MGEEITVDETNSVDEQEVEVVEEEGSETDAEETSKEEEAVSSSTEDTPEEDEDEEPPTRKTRTNADWVKLRQERKAQRDATKAKQGDNKEEQDDDDISPEDAKIIDRRVQQHLAPILEERHAKEIQSEIDDFTSENPEFKPFATKAAKWAKSPAWENVPTKQLMYAVAGEKLLTIGAQRRAEADLKAKRTRVAGGNAGGNAGGKSVTDMTDAEFQAELQSVLHKRRD